MIWIAGVALLVVLTADVFLTIFHPQAHGGPVNRVLLRVIWRLTATLAQRIPVGRDRMLSLGGPLLALSTIFAWGTLYVTGFALVYYDFLGELIFAEVRTSDWAEALYYSGMLASTLGLGDVVPSTAWLRLLAVAQALGGFIIVSVAVTYILSVYAAHRRSTALALDHWAAFAPDPDAGVRRAIRNLDGFSDWADDTARALNDVMGAHAQFPILHYFRPPDARQSLLVQLRPLVYFFERFEVEVPERRRDELITITTLRNALDRFLEEVAHRFARAELDDDVRDPLRLRALRLAAALRHMKYDPDDPDRAPQRDPEDDE